jgi:hypothetical protein
VKVAGPQHPPPADGADFDADPPQQLAAGVAAAFAAFPPQQLSATGFAAAACAADHEPLSAIFE